MRYKMLFQSFNNNNTRTKKKEETRTNTKRKKKIGKNISDIDSVIIKWKTYKEQ